MPKFPILCATLVVLVACAKNNVNLAELRQELETERQLLRETRAELQAVISTLEPLLGMMETLESQANVRHEPAPHVPSAPDASELTETLTEGIRKVDDLHYEVDRGALDQILANPGGIARQARIVPAIKNGNANGFKVYAIRPGSLYARLGIRNGDNVHRVNGHALSSPDRALEAYTLLRDADRIELEMTRQGELVRLVIEINP